MQAGFAHARGTIIVAMDGDLQNDPADISKLVAKLDEGFDLCLQQLARGTGKITRSGATF